MPHTFALCTKETEKDPKEGYMNTFIATSVLQKKCLVHDPKSVNYGRKKVIYMFKLQLCNTHTSIAIGAAWDI